MKVDITLLGREQLIDQVRVLQVRADRAEQRARLYAHHVGQLEKLASEAGVAQSRISDALMSRPGPYGMRKKYGA